MTRYIGGKNIAWDMMKMCALLSVEKNYIYININIENDSYKTEKWLKLNETI